MEGFEVGGFQCLLGANCKIPDLEVLIWNFFFPRNKRVKKQVLGETPQSILMYQFGNVHLHFCLAPGSLSLGPRSWYWQTVTQSVLWLLLSLSVLSLDPCTGQTWWILAVTLPLHHCCWAWEDLFLIHSRIRTRKNSNGCLPLLPELPFEHSAGISCGGSSGREAQGCCRGLSAVGHRSWVEAV